MTERGAAAVWEEARKSLSAARMTAQKPLRYAVSRYTRRLDPQDLRVLAEHRTAQTGFHTGSPFVSRPADELSAEGYIVHGPGIDFLYFGPDPPSCSRRRSSTSTVSG